MSSNFKILVVLAAAFCGSITNPTPDGQILTVMLEKAAALKNQDDPLLAEQVSSEGLVPRVQPPREMRLTD